MDLFSQPLGHNTARPASYYLRRERLVGPDPAADARVVPRQVAPQVERARVGLVAHQTREPLLARVAAEVLLGFQVKGSSHCAQHFSGTNRL